MSLNFVFLAPDPTDPIQRYLICRSAELADDYIRRFHLERPVEVIQFTQDKGDRFPHLIRHQDQIQEALSIYQTFLASVSGDKCIIGLGIKPR